MPTEDLIPSAVDVIGNDLVLPNGKVKGMQAGTLPTDGVNRTQLDAVATAAAAATSAEATRATAAEGTITASVSAEAASRIAGDTSNANAIAAETTRATGVEADLEEALDVEATAREAGDEQNATAITALTGRQIIAGAGLTGGGNLTANRTLAVNIGTTAGTVAAGDDPRFDGIGSGEGVPTTRTLGFAAPAFTGAGDLSANRTIAPVFGDQAGTFCEGNDPRLAGLGSEIVFGDGPGEVTEGNDSRFATLAGGISAVESSIADETAARDAAYTSLFNDLVQEGQYRATGDTTNEAAIIAEASRATAAEALLVPTSRQVIAGTGLTGGGALSTDRTLTVAYGVTSGTAAEGNDARLSNARTPTAHAASHAGDGADPIANASTTVAGLMSGADKTKLDALPASAVPSTRAINSGTGLSGGGSLAADRTLSVSYGTTAGTAAEGNDARITSAVPNTRTVTAGTGLTGGGDLSANRTFACSFGTTTGTVCQGDDTRVVNAVQNTRQVLAGTGLTGGGTLAADRTLAVSFGTTSTTACVGNDTRVVNAVQTTRTITAGTGLTGGGDLTANRTLACSFGTTTGTVCEGNDTRVVNAVQSSRQVLAGTGLTGGGTLAADRTLTVAYGTTASTACEGNDTRVVNAVPNTRSVAAGTGLTGGGALSADRTLAVAYGTTAGTAAQGNDARLSDARAPTAHASSHVGGGSDAIANATTSVAGLMSGADKTKLDGLPSSAVPTTRTITAGTGLTGGGDLSADRTLAVSYGTAAGTACQGNDARLSRSVTVTPVSATYNVTSADNGSILHVDTTAARTINLPSPTGLGGFNFVVKDATGSAATNVISLVRAGSEQIEGVAATKTLAIIRGAWFVYTDGTNWFVNGPS